MKFNNLELLRVFISVAENAGFTRAAGELHRSQSAISMQIKRLEEMVGATVWRVFGLIIRKFRARWISAKRPTF